MSEARRGTRRNRMSTPTSRYDAARGTDVV